jgi:hypothetical protein
MKDLEEEDECFDDIFEHTILDQLLLDWDVDTDDKDGDDDEYAGPEGEDECIVSVKFTGDCTGAEC